METIELKGLPYKIDRIGPDAGTDDYDVESGRIPPDAKWMVEWYKYGSYDGDGYAVWQTDAGYHWCSLSHCSCYGAWGDGDNRHHAKASTADELREWLFRHDALGKLRTEADYDWEQFAALQAAILPRLPSTPSASDNGND